MRTQDANLSLRENLHNLCLTGVKPSVRHKGFQVKQPVADKCLSTISSKTQDMATSRKSCSTVSSEIKSTNTSAEEYIISEVNTSSSYADEEILNIQRNEEYYKVTLEQVTREPKLLIGLIPQMFFIIELLSMHTVSAKHIILTLMKIKLNDSFRLLELKFGLSYSYASRIFCNTVPIVAKFFATHIFWPERDTTLKLLPIPFRANYGNIQSIIDCFEIQIEKPTNPMLQSQTWSSYKSCNTIKYLISATPDGMVNFISRGCTGRVSDAQIIQNSGYLDVLPEQTAVMADRGFKNIGKLLDKKKCSLIRPPSATANEKMSEQDVLTTKSIAALRVHIERNIRRVREYAILKPHSTVQHNLLTSVDNIVIIVAGLINVQYPIIKSVTCSINK